MHQQGGHHYARGAFIYANTYTAGDVATNYDGAAANDGAATGDRGAEGHGGGAADQLISCFVCPVVFW
jgi:hypothetical protein